MPNPPAFDIQAAHRYFAAYYFNACWNLIEKPDRSNEEGAQMVRLSLTSLQHWSEWEGVTDTNFSIGYWQVSRVYSLIGQAEEARRYAEYCQEISWDLPPFYKAYAKEARARAEWCAGDEVAARQWAREAAELTEEVTDMEERQMLLKDLATLPSGTVPE